MKKFFSQKWVKYAVLPAAIYAALELTILIYWGLQEEFPMIFPGARDSDISFLLGYGMAVLHLPADSIAGLFFHFNEFTYLFIGTALNTFILFLVGTLVGILRFNEKVSMRSLRQGLGILVLIIAVIFGTDFLLYSPLISECRESRGTGRDKCYVNKAIAENDDAICNKLASENERTSCQAAARKDVSLCDTIEYDFIKWDCIQGVAVQSDDATLCDLIEWESNKDECHYQAGREKNEFDAICGGDITCIFDEAVKQKDYTICQKIADEQYRRHCIARASYNVAVCDALTDRVKKDDCYAIVSAAECKQEHCNSISDSTKQKACHDAIVIVGDYLEMHCPSLPGPNEFFPPIE